MDTEKELISDAPSCQYRPAWPSSIGRGKKEWHLSDSYSNVHCLVMFLWVDSKHQYLKEAWIGSTQNPINIYWIPWVSV